MEWIRISSNKLKIMLTAEDARRYDLQCEKADYANPETRHSFRAILTDVRRETGFDATEDKVYIQMYPSKEGGCELFVTKIGLLLTEDRRDSEKAERPHAEKRGAARECTAFRFSKTANLLAACRHLRNVGFSGESEAWLGEDEKLWLILTQRRGCALQESLRMVREFGQPVAASAAKLFLPEHGKRLLATRAVEILGAL